MSHLEHRRAEIGEVSLHYTVAGTGDPVVLLHGWPQTWFCWRKVIPLLMERYQVVAPDLRGLGDSSRPSSGYDAQTLSEDIHRLMSGKLGLGRYFVVGHDWGGVVAYSLAASHPESVAALAVVDVTIPGSGATDISQGGRRWHHGLHRTATLPEALITGREDVYLRWFFETFGHKPGVISDDEIGEYLRTYSDPEALRAGFELYRATPKNIADTKAHSAAGLLGMPVLAVGGADGWGRGKEVADSLRSLAHNVHGVVIQGAGHWVAEEQPAALAEHLVDFFASTPLIEGR